MNSVALSIPMVPPSVKRGSWGVMEDEFLRSNYPQRGKSWSAERLGRSEGSIRKRASVLRLRLSRNGDFFKDFQSRAAATKIGRKRPQQADVIRRLHQLGKMTQTPEQRKRRSEGTQRWFVLNGHPRGFLGHRHTERVRLEQASRSRRLWADPNSKVNSEEFRNRKSDQVMLRRKNGLFNNGGYSRCKGGRRSDLGGMFFRSSWEANYARILQFLKAHGGIYDWLYEAEEFWFHEIKRGTRSYLPDFKVWDKQGSIPRFVEVKGWMDQKSRTKLDRMKQYYPTVKLEVVGAKEYRVLKRQMQALIPNWETGVNPRTEITASVKEAA